MHTVKLSSFHSIVIFSYTSFEKILVRTVLIQISCNAHSVALTILWHCLVAI